MVKSGGTTDVSVTLPTELVPAGPAPSGATISAAPPGPAALSEPRPLAPTQLRDPDRYQIIAEHGRGGLGRVSRAHDRELGRDVAIKELLSRGHIGEARFLREAMITARLEHPGIVPVHEAGRWPDGTPFYAMKLVSGRPLRELIAERATALDRIGLLHHVIAVADAIAYAHGRNIIHRDLKPANVIVGDFGETIVIDWGLAKDLTASEDSASGGDPLPVTRDDGLTVAGSILGTPAYMAPEQMRGEHVDQRADVYAIGAMLWELCTVERVSSVEPHLRHRALRRAGIDNDLATIIDKALDPDLGRRYPDAGALAADLKAFKSGARIAARDYSLFAVLAHWIRRHRTLALSVSCALVIAVAGTVAYVRNIAVERDRADTALTRVEASKADLDREHAELTLKHAQLLLTTDPSAAIDALATYHGADQGRASQLRAEAVGRGTAVVRAVPHTGNVSWVEGMPDGTIVSLSVDGTIARTSRDGTSVVLARGTAPWSVVAYARSRHLLAYACVPADLCLLDVLHGTPIPIAPEFRGAQLAGLAFSPSGGQLALISGAGVLRVFDVAAPAQPVLRRQVRTGDGQDALFVDEDAIAVATPTGVQLVRMTGDPQTLLVPDGLVWDASVPDHRLAIATTRGEGLLVETAPLRIATRQTLCHDTVGGLRFIPGQPALVYACKEGTVGIWDLPSGVVTPRTHLEGHVDHLQASAAGDYLLATGGNGTLAVIDLYTNLVTAYRGHEFLLTAMSPPRPEYPWILSADVRGGVRAWPLPDRSARVVAKIHRRFSSAVFNERAAAIVATTLVPELTIFPTSSPTSGDATSGGVRSVEPHVVDAIHLASAADGRTFATYGVSDLVELWSSPAMSRTRVLDTHQGSVSHLEFVEGSDEFVTAGRDGRLVRWTATGESEVIARFDQPIVMFGMVPETRSVVVSTADGALWRTADGGRILAVRAGGVQVTRMLRVPGATWICIGYANGEVIAVDTKSWRQTSLLHASETVQDIALTPDGRTIAVATNDGIIHVGVTHGAAWTDTGWTWRTWTARARQIALTPDGILVAICTDGTVWLYSCVHQTWSCLPTGTADLSLVVVTPDAKAGAVFDNEGRITWIDLETVRKALDGAHGPMHERRLQR